MEKINNKENESPQKVLLTEGTTIPSVILKAFQLNPELKISVIYKGKECLLLYTGGKICIKPSEIQTIYLERIFWNDISIREQEYQKVEDVILQNKLKNAVVATREEPGFDFLDEESSEPKLSESEKAVKKLFTETIWSVGTLVSNVTTESVHLVCEGMKKRFGDSWKKIAFEKIPLKYGFQIGEWMGINIANAKLLGQIADCVAGKLKLKGYNVNFIKNRSRRPVILKIACESDSLYLQVKIGQ